MSREPDPDLFDTERMYKRAGTSSLAASGAAEKARLLNRHRQIWAALLEQPRTADEIASDLKLCLNTARARISELHKQGWVAATGFTRSTAAGKPADVWRAVRKRDLSVAPIASVATS